MRTNKQVKSVLDRATPFAKAFKNWEPDESIVARFNPHMRAAADANETTLNIYSSIGEYFDWFTGETSGTGAKTVSNFLDKADGRDVVININSPGGDYFEGLAIYNLLDQYEGEVHVRVIGLAASAASFIAMAGDTIEIAKAGFFMIHNAMTCACGNKEAMRECADVLQQLDAVMASIYVDQTGQDDSEIKSMLDAETWISGEESVDMGFASGFLGDKDVVEEEEKSGQTRALKRLDSALAKGGMPRNQRRKLIGAVLVDDPDAPEAPATPCAGNESPTPCAGHDDKAFLTALADLRDTIKPTNP